MVDTCWMMIDKLTSNGRNARTHSRKQICQIADSIAAFGFVVPILIDDDGVIIAGHGRFAAAKLLDLKQVLTIKVTGLSQARRRALALADNRIAEGAGWDRERLAVELPETRRDPGRGGARSLDHRFFRDRDRSDCARFRAGCIRRT
jgi:hypothetical protein